MEIINNKKLVNCILYFAKRVKYFGKTKLYKLLYNSDFIHFKETGYSITGLNYYAWRESPVPATLYHKLKKDILPEEFQKFIEIIKLGRDKKIHKIYPKVEPDMSVFSKREKRILEKIAKYFKDYKANRITEISHLKGKPWDKTKRAEGKTKKIDYILSLDDTPESITVEEAKEKQMMVEKMYLYFR